jgi:phosphoserine phosphatase
MIKAVVFDIDNTLTDDVSWLRITELLGASVAEHENIFKRMLNHELSYIDARDQLVQLWQATGNARRAYWEAMFAAWPLKAGARELVQHVHEQGYQTALITGSVDLFAEAIARQLDVSHWYANTRLEWDVEGNLVTFHYILDQAGRKLEQLQDFAGATGVLITDCAVVADGANDAETFRATKHGIVVGAGDASLLKVSWKQVDTLAEVAAILQAERA